MNLRRAFAAVLQLVRNRQGLLQQDLAGKVTQSHISQLETLKTSATLETSQQLAQAMGLHPVSFLTLVHAAQEEKSGREVLELVTKQLDALSLLDLPLPKEPEVTRPPQTEKAERARIAVQELRAMGKTQREVMDILGLPRSTVGRHWHRTE